MAKLDREKPKQDAVVDVTEEQIARIYSQAFMGVAAKSPDPTALVDEVVSIVNDVLERIPQFDETLRSELVSPEDKTRLLDRAFKSRASVPVLNFLKVLAAHGRLAILRSIARVLKQLDARRRGLIDVEVRVAAPLDDAVQREVETRLGKTLGGQPVLNVVVDPSLIAGMVIRVGDRVYDGSIHTQLERARRAMIERATETIETQADRFLSSSA